MNDLQIGVQHSQKSDLELLQEILLSKNTAALDALKQRLDDTDLRAKEVAEVLSAAITQKSGQKDLAFSLLDPVSMAFQLAIKLRPTEIANLLFPVMLPAIRRSIEESMRGVMERIDLLMTEKFSIRSLKWRWEAYRTGVPFAEIMLRRILKYQAEQVFLIQKRSGLLIEHVSIENAVTKDSDAVSAMLTAIESFVVESFTKNEREEGLDRITVGERIIYLEHGPYAVVAAVIRGVAPPEYRHTLKEINEELHALEPQHLQSFDGNTQDAPVIRPFLLRGLEREYITADVAIEELPPKTINTKKQHKKWFLWTILSMLLLGILGLFIQHQRQHVQLEKLLNLLATTPGIMISHTVTSNKPWQLHGLRDPNAVNPQLLAQKFSAIRDQLQFHLEPFISLDERVVTSRAIAELKIPHSIHTRVAGSVLHLSGFVPLDWYLSFVNTQPSIAGISRLDTSQLRLNPTDRVNLLLAFGIDKQQLDFRGDVIIVNKTVASRIQQRLIPILQALDLKHAIKLTYQ